jgi:hypothetical protein
MYEWKGGTPLISRARGLGGMMKLEAGHGKMLIAGKLRLKPSGKFVNETSHIPGSMGPALARAGSCVPWPGTAQGATAYSRE